ncbi:PsiF repeat-containing protein [Rhizobium sp. P38BS-XIX]|nr:PsiF repeat-containing protein [Rhizobium sp. P38BS-XIX]
MTSKFLCATAAALLSLCSTTVVFAQTTTPATTAAPAPVTTPSTSTSATAMPSKDEIKTARQACRQDAVGQGLKGQARKDSVKSCLQQKYPILAKRKTCHDEGTTKGLEKKALRDFVKQCVAAG